MRNTLFSTALKVRFALWAIELALPSGADLEQRFQAGLLGIVAAVAGGVLVALAVGGLCAAFGMGLYRYGGFSLVGTLLLAGSLTLGLVLILLGMGKAKLDEAFRAFSSPAAGSGKSFPDDDALKALINGFIAGMVAEKSTEDSESA